MTKINTAKFLQPSISILISTLIFLVTTFQSSLFAIDQITLTNGKTAYVKIEKTDKDFIYYERDGEKRKSSKKAILSVEKDVAVPNVWIDYLAKHKAGKLEDAKLIDYSWAGYQFGRERVPYVTNRKIFDVTAYGAIANDEIEDRDAIILAIRAAESNRGGIVFFPPGRFLINEVAERREGITIEMSNIILRGSGMGKGGTELFMKHYLLPNDPSKLWTVPFMFTFRAPESLRGKSENYTTLAKDVKKGSFHIEVADGTKLKAGMMINITMQNIAANDTLMAGQSPWPLWKTTLEKGVRIDERHKVLAVENNIVTLETPVRTVIKAEWKVTISRFACFEGWGVEDIHFRGNFQEELVHHLNFIHDAGWSVFRIERGVFPFARRIRMTDINQGLTMPNSYGADVRFVVFDGVRGHSMMSPAGPANGMFMGFIHDNTATGMYHGPDTSGSAAGTVVFRYVGKQKSGPDFHASWPYATLWDSTVSGIMGNGGNLEVLPNHLQDLTWWNFKEIGVTKGGVYDFWEPRKGTENYSGAKIVLPNIIGFQGQSGFIEKNLGVFELYGKQVQPLSLYKAQLALRLGEVPAWFLEEERMWEEYLKSGDLEVIARK